MPKTILTPDDFVEAALAIAARAEPDGLSVSRVGTNSRSTDRPCGISPTGRRALLRAVGDRLMQLAPQQVPANLAPRERLRAASPQRRQTFVAYPAWGRRSPVERCKDPRDGDG